MSGYNSIFNLDVETKNLLLNSEVICLCETWLINTEPSLPSFLNKYHSFHQSAIKDKSRGRASGGLSVLSKHNINILEQSNMWLFLKLKTNCGVYIIGNIYFKPQLDDTVCCQLLQECILELLDLYSHLPFIIFGDFNARVGQINDVDDYMLEYFYMTTRRESLDDICSRRGKILNDLMQNAGLVLLNGRTKGDIPGQYTFLNSNGKSTIDLVWANFVAINLVEELRIVPVSISDHAVSGLFIKKTNWSGNEAARTSSIDVTHQKIKWDLAELERYQIELNKSTNIYFNSENVDELNCNLIQAIKTAADSCGMIHRVKFNHQNPLRETRPWYNQECRKLKKLLRKSLQSCKKTHFQQNEQVRIYTKAKKEYRNLLSKQKREHQYEIIQKIRNIKNTKDFWTTVKTLHPKKTQDNNISIENWKKHLKNLYPIRHIDNKIFFDVLHPWLDDEITLAELQNVIHLAKNNKTPGADCIPNEFYKNLTPQWEHYLLNMLNEVFRQEKIPKAWTMTQVCFLHKKGSRDEVLNYRSIALLNHISKLFTNIINLRLCEWIEVNNILHENQAGFRRNRGTMDNIFALASIMQIHMRLRKSCLYAIFVDFKGAFDSVNHNQLWEDLYSSGVSAKIIRVIAYIYQRMKAEVKMGGNISDPIDITQGVLQGEPWSPALFSVFINDIETYFREHGLEGLDINGIEDLLMLIYADDIVILAKNPVDVQKKLKTLEDYAVKKKLVVNIEKTKILIFHKGKRKHTPPFTFKNKIIETVNKFTYLGISFSSSGKFLEATKHQITKANMAVGSVRNILTRSKSDSWNTKMELFDSIVKSSLCYGAQVWSLQYTEKLESVQIKFLKQILNCPMSTPNHMLRLETGRRKLSVSIWKNTLMWLINLESMPDNRYPKLLYKRLRTLDQSQNNKIEYNWVTQIRSFLERSNFGHLWQDPKQIKYKITDIVQHFSDLEWQNDLQHLAVTKYNDYYSILKETNTECENYLKFNTHINKIRVFSQIRLSSKFGLQIYYKGLKYKLDATNNCTICCLQKKEDIYHFLVECPIYNPVRHTFLDKYLNDAKPQNFLQLLSPPNIEKLNNIFCYIIQALKIRSFIMQE